MTTAVAGQTSKAAVTPPNFMATLNSEWTKIRSIRATYVQVVLALGLSLGMTALICLAIGSTWDDLTAQDQAEFDPVFTSFFGSVFGLIVLLVTAVTFISAEYSSGMMRLTLAATPRRGRVLAAKLVVITGLTLAIGFVVAFGSFLIGQAVLGSYEGVATSSLSDGDTFRAVMASWLTTPLYPILGAALAVMLRSTASALTAILALIFVPSFFGALLPQWVEENVIRYLIGPAADNLIMTNPDRDSATYLATGEALVVVAVWLVAFVSVAYWLITKRDV